MRVDGGSTLTTDGPFAETKEALGGFYLIEADDLDTALEIAARVPAARLGGSVEVRPEPARPALPESTGERSRARGRAESEKP